MSKEVEEAIKIVENIKIGLMNFNELINDNKEIMDSVDTVLNYIKELEEKIKLCEDTGTKLINKKTLTDNFINKHKEV